MTDPKTPEKRPLTASEREIVLTIADDEESWTAFADSPKFMRRLRKVGTAWGATIQPRGQGIVVILPLKAVRFSSPPSASRVAAGRASIQKANLSRKPTEEPSLQAPLASEDVQP